MKIKEMIDSKPWYIKFLNRIRCFFGHTIMFWIKIDEGALLTDTILSKKVISLLYSAFKIGEWVHVVYTFRIFGKERFYINGKEID